MLGLLEYDVRAAGGECCFVLHFGQHGDAVVQAFFLGSVEAGANVPCAVRCHGDGAGDQSARYAVIGGADGQRGYFVFQIQVGDLLDGLDGGGFADGELGAVLLRKAAAVGEAGHFKLPGQVLNQCSRTA